MQRDEHAAQRAETALAQVLAIGEHEELARLVERAAGLAVHEDLAVAGELEVAQPLSGDRRLAALGDVRRQVAVSVDQATTDDSAVVVREAVEDRAKVMVG